MTTELSILAQLKDEASRPLNQLYTEFRDLEYAVETFDGEFQVEAIGVGFDKISDYLNQIENIGTIDVEVLAHYETAKEAYELLADIGQLSPTVGISADVSEIESADSAIRDLPDSASVDVNVNSAEIKAADSAIHDWPDSASVDVNVNSAEIKAADSAIHDWPDSASVDVNVNSAEIKAADSAIHDWPDSASVDVNVNDNDIDKTIKKLKEMEKEGEDAVDSIGDAFEGLPGQAGDAIGAVDDIAGSLTALGASGPLAFVAIGAAAIAFGIDAVGAYAEVEEAQNKLERRLNISAERSEELGSVARDALRDGFFESAGDAIDAVGSLQQRLGEVSEGELQDLATRTEAVGDTFEEEFNAIAAAANSVSENFDIPYPEALDLITVGMQRGLNNSEDLLDSLTEYSPNFAGAGGSAEQFFSMLDTGFQEGVNGTDKAGDAFKEFTLRVQDGSDSTREALGVLGIDYDTLDQQIRSGAVSQADAFQLVLNKLGDVDNATAQAIIQGGSFGTQFEDLGLAAVRNLSLAEGAFYGAGEASVDLRDNYKDLISEGKRVGANLREIKFEAGEAFSPVAGTFLSQVNTAIDGTRHKWGGFVDDFDSSRRMFSDFFDGGSFSFGRETQGRHEGGDVSSGRAYLVGDDSQGNVIPGTTELFVPKQSGMIVSGSQLQTAMNALSPVQQPVSVVASMQPQARKPEAQEVHHHNGSIQIIVDSRETAQQVDRVVRRAMAQGVI